MKLDSNSNFLLLLNRQATNEIYSLRQQSVIRQTRYVSHAAHATADSKVNTTHFGCV